MKLRWIFQKGDFTKIGISRRNTVQCQKWGISNQESQLDIGDNLHNIKQFEQKNRRQEASNFDLSPSVDLSSQKSNLLMSDLALFKEVNCLIDV